MWGRAYRRALRFADDLRTSTAPADVAAYRALQCAINAVQAATSTGPSQEMAAACVRNGVAALTGEVVS